MNITLGEEITPTRSYGEAGPPSSQTIFDNNEDIRTAGLSKTEHFIDLITRGPVRIAAVLTGQGRRIRVFDVAITGVYILGLFTIIKKVRKK